MSVDCKFDKKAMYYKKHVSEETATVPNAIKKSCERNRIHPTEYKSTWNTVLFDFQSIEEHPSDSSKCVVYAKDVINCRDVLPMPNRKKQSLDDCISHKKTSCKSCREALDKILEPGKEIQSFKVEIKWECKKMEDKIEEHLQHQEIKYKDGSGVLKEIGELCKPEKIE